eukprot:TRINITY_DN69207_c0_g1_i1.p1 TRINITY_DN69207_c0_g1~~TRINITY_DN69207_c0_g1_i1.p1  ORF type:complete len:269 (-),score=21.60 TRINITY_DN69207_c0_g1_i1:540-1346(-)
MHNRGVLAKTTAEEETDDEEPSSKQHMQQIAIGSVISGCSYGVCRIFSTSSRTEDLVDLAHSVYSTSVALIGYAATEPHPLHSRALPAKLARGRSFVVRMFCHSLGYFLADTALITVDVLFRGKYPHLWAGRLAHHTVQFLANAPTIFGRSRAQNLALRTTLCMAYTAELSSIFLRLSNMMRGASLPARRLVNWTLVVSFFFSRVLNFWPTAMVVHKARPLVDGRVYATVHTIMGVGYCMSLAWFLKIIKIALNTTAASSSRHTSLEC